MSTYAFLSTSPLRGTTDDIETALAALYFYPRPPCGGRRDGSAAVNQQIYISIHVPLAGDDAEECDNAAS